MTDHEALMAQLDRLHVSINETVAERDALLNALRAIKTFLSCPLTNSERAAYGVAQRTIAKMEAT
jgi:hypothetical protein